MPLGDASPRIQCRARERRLVILHPQVPGACQIMGRDNTGRGLANIEKGCQRVGMGGRGRPGMDERGHPELVAMEGNRSRTCVMASVATARHPL